MIRVTKGTLAQGAAGVMQTLGVMADMIRAAPQSPVVMGAARMLGTSSQYRSAMNILFFARRGFRYVDDPVYEEHVQDAEVMLQEYRDTAQVKGDCDDAAVLAGSLATCVGIEVELTVVAFDEGPGVTPRYQHVFATLVPADGPAVPVDVTRPTGPTAQVVKTMTVAV